MSLKPIQTDHLESHELRTIYEISRIILQAGDVSSALKEIIRFARPIFIFDNVVLYQLDDNALEPTYARSVGRGRSAEADMAWGQSIAQAVIEKTDVVLLKEETDSEDQPEEQNHTLTRLNCRYFLGLPLWEQNEVIGALVFVRFGGPNYLPDQVNLARLIAEHIQHLLQRQLLTRRVVNLEAQRQLDLLQQEFVATISHNLRTPLGFIKGYATTLLRDEINWDPETRKEFLNIIDEEADRLSEMIDNLLDSSRLQTGTLKMAFQAIQVESLIENFYQKLRVGGENLNISLQISPSTNRVYVDPTRIIQVFDNLITNAAKYAPGADLLIRLDWEPEHAHIIIKDTGPGIPEDELENIFKRFYRLARYKDEVKGSGLGLYICRQIVDAHQGQIYAESVLGASTTFHVILPIHRAYS